jgi:hypothetical protein
MYRISVLSTLLCLFLIIESKAQVNTSPYSNDICVGSSKALFVIDLYEGSLDDFTIDGTPRTIIYQTTGGSFVPDVGTATTNAPNTSISAVITASQITVTISATDAANLSTDDYISVSGIEFAAASAVTEDIYYAGGTLAINGLSVNDPVGHVNGIAPAIPGLSGPLSTCADALNVQYVTETGVTDFVWNITGHSGISNGGGSGDHFIDINWGPAGSGSVSVSYTDANGCNTEATMENITINGPAPTITSGEAVVCQNSEYTYTTEPGASNYDWFTTGGSPVDDGNPNDNSFTVEWFSTEGPSIYVQATAEGCTVSSPTLFVSYPQASNTTADLCSGTTVNFDLQN